MSQTCSPSTQRRYGLARVSTVYLKPGAAAGAGAARPEARAEAALE